MNSSRILLLDSTTERRKETSFLLRLADFSVVAVDDDYEAYNLLVNCLETSNLPDLFLVNRQRAEMPILQLLPKLREHGVDVPVLIVQRDEGNGSCGEIPDADNTFDCLPENMLTQVRHLTQEHGSSDSNLGHVG